MLRRMIWLYFVLLIAEGALRKWFVPSLSVPLLVIRDPLVLLIYAQAARCRRFPVSGPMVACFLLLSSFVLLALFQIIAGVGGGPLVVVWPTHEFSPLTAYFRDSASVLLLGRGQTGQMDADTQHTHGSPDDLAIPVYAGQLDQCGNYGGGRKFHSPWERFDQRAPSVLPQGHLTFLFSRPRSWSMD